MNMHRQADRQTDRQPASQTASQPASQPTSQTDRQTDRQRGRHTDTQTHTHTHIQNNSSGKTRLVYANVHVGSGHVCCWTRGTVRCTVIRVRIPSLLLSWLKAVSFVHQSRYDDKITSKPVLLASQFCF